MTTILRLCISFFILGRYPCYYYKWYLGGIIILVSLRVCYLRYIKCHYFLLEHSYFIQFTMLLYFWLFPDNRFLFNALFVTANGPILWVMSIFFTPLVLHQFDRLTIVFMYFEPAMALMNLEWNNCAGFCTEFYSSPLAMFASAFLLYVGWGIVYFYLIFVMLQYRWKERGYIILFNYALKVQNPLVSLIKCKGEKWYVTMFILVHIGYHVVTMIIGTFVQQWWVFQAANIFLNYFMAMWFGTMFYFNYFPRAYEDSLKGTLRLLEEAKNGKDN